MTHTWTKICFLLFVVVPVSATSSPDSLSYGEWVKSDGTSVSMRCPTPDLFSDRPLKLPKTCESHAPGVWLSVSQHKTLVAKNAELEAKLKATQAALDELRRTIRSERLELSNYFKSSSSQLNYIQKSLSQDKFSWSSAGIGLATGLTFCGGAWLGASF